MQRRRFLTTLLSLLAAPAAAKAASLPMALRRSVLIQESPVAGFQYHAGGTVWNRLREGDPSASCAPTNPYDPKAVRVDWQGRKLGYVPRMENTAVAQMLDRGERLTARIMALRESCDPWERVRFAVLFVV